jgi:predicted dehydrogenase
MVGHLLLYHPAARYIKELVSSGRLGEIYYAYSTRVNLGRIRRDENVIWSLCPHDIAVLLYLFDTSPTWMACTGQVILNPGIEDLAYLTMGFPGGRLGHIHASWLDPCKIRRLVVVGSTAMVVFDDMEAQEKIRIYDRGVEPTAASTSYSESSKIRFGDILIPKISTEEPLRIECRHFVECIREEKPPMTDGRNGYEVVKLLEAAQRALKERRTITL